MRRLPSILMLLFASASCLELCADWPRFRGPNGSGISAEANKTPEKWSPDSLKWKIELPGPGSSCPIVIGDKVFITCWTGYGMLRDFPGEQADLRRHLVCYQRETGKELWRSTVDPVLPEDDYGGMFAEHGYATHTPVSDGEHVYAFFGKTGVVAFDMKGKNVWQKSVGTGSGAKNWGTSSSPIIHNDLLIVPAMAESESIVAFDKRTGEEKWKSESGGYVSTWGTPIVVETDGATEVVIAVPEEIWAINADTGKLKWFAEAVPASSLCSSCVVDKDNVIYAIESGPRGGGGVAIRAGGKKDVTESHGVWSGDQSGRIASPIVSDGKLYTISNKIFTCLDAKTGDELYKSRLRSASGGGGTQGGGRGGRGGGRGGQDYGSPVMADGKIYFTSRTGETFVIKAGDKFEQIAANRVTTDVEDFSSTPAVSDGALFIRSDMHLYCVE